MERAITNFEQNGFTTHAQVGTTNIANGKKSLWKASLQKGKYLLRVSTIYTNGSGNVSSDNVVFETSLPNKEVIKTNLHTYNMYGYSYPLSFSEILEVEEGDCEVFIANGQMNCSIMNTHVVLNPIMQVN